MQMLKADGKCVANYNVICRVFIVCNLILFVVDAIGDNMVEAHSNIIFVIALYIVSSVSLCLPHLVKETLNTGIVLDYLVTFVARVFVVSEFRVEADTSNLRCVCILCLPKYLFL